MNTRYHLINLSNFLSKSSPHNANILQKLADYERDHKARIHEQTKDRHMPFEDLFQGKDRIYIDFKPMILPNQSDKAVKDALELEGYIITDYQKGLTSPPNNSSNQSEVRIGKALKKIKDSYGASILDLKHKGATREALIPIVLKWVKVKSAIKTFNASPIRASKNEKNSELQIVYTRHTDDIATMSTDKQWRSCLDLNDGHNEDVVINEVMAGGIIAYIIKKGDNDIKDPLSRILIRRVKSNSDLGIKMLPEHAVYGIPVQGFMREIIRFAEEYNKNIEGSYQLLGGTDWSDSIKHEYGINPKRISIKEYIDKIKSIENNESKDLRLNKKTSTVHLLHTLKELSFQDIVNYYINIDDTDDSFTDTADLFNVKHIISYAIQTKITNKQEAENNRYFIYNLLNNEEFLNSLSSFGLEWSLKYIKNTFLLTEEERAKLALNARNESLLYFKLDPANIFLDPNDLKANEFDIYYTHNMLELMLILNSIAGSKERAVEIMRGSNLTKAESESIEKLGTNYNPDQSLIETLLHKIVKHVEAVDLNINYLIEAFAENKNKSYIITIIKKVVDEIVDANEDNYIPPSVLSINPKIINKLRNDPNRQLRFLARELFRAIKFIRSGS